MGGIEALNPSSNHFADVDCLIPFAEAYMADTDDLMHELHQVKRMLERLFASKIDENVGGVPDSLVTFVTYISRYSEAFYELCRLGRISLPVSTASCERSFSALRQIKTWVRNSV